jgi:hypothetical protein
MDEQQFERQASEAEFDRGVYVRQIIDRLERRGLLVFLDKERSKENTKRLRAKAHREVDNNYTTMFIWDRALRARDLQNER